MPDALRALSGAMTVGAVPARIAKRRLLMAGVPERRFGDPWDLSDLKISEVDLSGCNLEQVVFDNTVLTNVDFGNAELFGASFQGATIQGGSFAGAATEHADFKNAKFLGIDDPSTPPEKRV